MFAPLSGSAEPLRGQVAANGVQASLRSALLQNPIAGRIRSAALAEWKSHFGLVTAHRALNAATGEKLPSDCLHRQAVP